MAHSFSEARFCKLCGVPFIALTPGKQYCSETCQFWSKVQIGCPEECWEWQGTITSLGYAVIKLNKKSIRANRFSWFINRGPIPWYADVLHHCDNPKCVNPNHLFLGTGKINMEDKITKGRHRCGIGENQGHSIFTEDAVRDMRKLYEDGWTQRAIAKKHRCSAQTVWPIVHRINWKHVA